MSAETEAGTDPTREAQRLRDQMVDRVMGGRGYGATERAFRAVPRHVFLPGLPLERVYSGDVIPTRHNEQGHPISSSSEVGVMAPMIQALQLAPGHRVLEVGAGTGYNAAIVAEIVGTAGEVTTIDIDAEIAREARERLERAGHPEVTVVTGDGWLGSAEHAPYDRIELTASASDISPHWVEQLVVGGILVVPFQFRPNAQAIVAFRRDNDALRSVALIPGGFMPLRGSTAPPDGTVRIDGWRVVTSRPVDPERLRALLALEPTVEVDAGMTWASMSLLGILEPDSISLSREGRVWSMGLYEESAGGIAVMEWTGGTLSGSRVLLAGVGSPSTLARLRDRLAALRGRSLGELRVEARPTSSGERPRGDAVLERPSYTFTFALAVRAAATGT